MKKEFDESSYLSQVRRLRILAVEVLKEYSIERYELTFINHGENTTFKVVTKGNQKYLLRIHCRSHRTKKAFLEELKWLSYLASKTNIPVQKPVPTRDGKLLAYIHHASIGHFRYCDLLEWQDGYIKNSKTEHTFLKVGQLIGELQVNSIKSKHRRYWDTEGLIGKEATLGGLGKLEQDFPRCINRIEELRNYLFKKVSRYERSNPDKQSLIHADLHFGNMIWKQGQVQPIDFDDCGHGLEMYDLAVTLAQSSFYFKRIGRNEAYKSKQALLEGYANFKSLTQADIEILPFLVAVRELAMAGWLYDRKDNPDLWNHLKNHLGERLKKTQRHIDEAEKKNYFA